MISLVHKYENAPKRPENSEFRLGKAHEREREAKKWPVLYVSDNFRVFITLPVPAQRLSEFPSIPSPMRSIDLGQSATMPESVPFTHDEEVSPPPPTYATSAFGDGRTVVVAATPSQPPGLHLSQHGDGQRPRCRD